MNIRGNSDVIVPNKLRLSEKSADIDGPGLDVHYELYGAIFKETDKFVGAFKAKSNRLI